MPPSRRELQLQGPKPPPLTLNKDTWKVKKIAPAAPSCGLPPVVGASDRRNPVIVYVRTPRVIHATPQEFMSLVQSLTGKNANRCSSASSSGGSGVSTHDEVNRSVHCGNEDAGWCSSSSDAEVKVDPLLLTLGQVPFTPSDPSANSPSFLFCSPTTKRLLQEFSTLL